MSETIQTCHNIFHHKTLIHDWSPSCCTPDTVCPSWPSPPAPWRASPPPPSSSSPPGSPSPPPGRKSVSQVLQVIHVKSHTNMHLVNEDHLVTPVTNVVPLVLVQRSGRQVISKQDTLLEYFSLQQADVSLKTRQDEDVLTCIPASDT